MDNLEDAHAVYYEVYTDILKNLKRKIKDDNELFEWVNDQEKEGNQLFKEGIKARENIDGLTLKQENEAKQKAVNLENKGLETLLIAMECYYKIINDKNLTIADLTNENPEDSTKYGSDDEIIVVSKDALLHYNDRPEIHTLILQNFNVDSIEEPFFITFSELKHKKTILPEIQEDQNLSTKSENIEIIAINTELKADTGINIRTIEKSLETVNTTGTKTKTPQIITANLQTEKEPKNTDYAKNEYYTVQIAACRTPIPEEELKKYYPDIQDFNTRYEDQWYKYQLGNYNNKLDAITFCRKLNLNKAFVAKYKGEERISIVFVYKNN